MPPIKVFKWLFIVSVIVTLVSCKKEIQETTIEAETSKAQALTVTVNVMSSSGRSLAANCFQCHGTNGFAGELKIASMSSTELISKMNSFRRKDPKSDIMNFHAQAYTADEIKLIANYFSTQK